jgi:rhamnulokinase
MSRFLAFDLGAESGRAVVGHLEGEGIQLHEVHRFPNGAIRVGDNLHWDILRLWEEVQQGLAKAHRTYGNSLTSLGVDTWGVDFCLLGADDTLLGNPHTYRDSRTEGMLERAFDLIPREELFDRTGIQFLPINSLYQLLAMAETGSPALGAATSFLNMPDLFNFWLTGRKTNEFTIATTTQCFNPRADDWAFTVLEKLGIPTTIFGQIVPPGTLLGPLRSSVSEEMGCGPIPVVAPATHDTASAVAAVPMQNEDSIYLSSGTWSLMGIEAGRPIINKQCLAFGLTNEGGAEGTFRVLKNIVGLWLIQECRRTWARAGSAYSYDELTEMAGQAPAFGPLISLQDPRFLAPGDMPARILRYCGESGQAEPETRGEILRCAFESLALEYRWVADRLETLLGRPLGVIHIIGGGSRNHLLNQLTANATGRTVVAGPVEATAIGNVLVQALAMGEIASIAEGRTIVGRSFELSTFEPGDKADWDAALQRYLALSGRTRAAV